MILDLLAGGKRVGVTANSHKVISNLLDAVCEAAAGTPVEVRGIQKANDGDGCPDERIVQAGSNAEVVEALADGTANLADGTAWLWAREEMAGAVDVLVIDEAGQMSLANTLRRLHRPSGRAAPAGGRSHRNRIEGVSQLRRSRQVTASSRGHRRFHSPPVLTFSSRKPVRAPRWHAPCCHVSARAGGSQLNRGLRDCWRSTREGFSKRGAQTTRVLRSERGWSTGQLERADARQPAPASA